MVAQCAGRDVRVRDAAELSLVLVLFPILVCLTTVLVAVVLLVGIVCILAGYIPSFRRKLAAGPAVCITPRIEES